MTQQDNMQVWLDADSGDGLARLVPYVRCARDMAMHFSMEVLQRSGGSQSRMNQRGRVHAAAGRAVALAHVALGMPPGSACEVKVSFSQSGRELGVYRFDCSN
ncbi:hypothetical protein E4K72_06565 [Oxalobacteraceae bacterium OM1]|nr:hypothetical protein E4K72_06565 [Oxalobacteraceae bacterium OM1]